MLRKLTQRYRRRPLPKCHSVNKDAGKLVTYFQARIIVFTKVHGKIKMIRITAPQRYKEAKGRTNAL